MKKLFQLTGIVIIFWLLTIALCSQCKAQDNSDIRIDNIKLNLQKCHNEYSKGTELIGIGAVTGTAIFGGITLMNPSDKTTKYYVCIPSMLLIITGKILHIDSHKYIGRAGGVALKF